MNDNPMCVRVGDIVQVGPCKHVRAIRTFVARVEQLKDVSGHSIMTYRLLEGVTPKFPLCNVSLVTRVIQRAPVHYRPPRNIYAEAVATELLYCSVRRGGVRRGSLWFLVREALASVRHLELVTPMHTGRIEDLYERALWRGMIEVPPGYPNYVSTIDIITVRWKTFERWVHSCAQRLVQSKSEVAARKAAHKRAMDDDLRGAIIADMDALDEANLVTDDSIEVGLQEAYDDTHCY
jgi:hypothetical protein